MSGPRTDVAVVGMACRYPGAASPRELWDNALAGRRAFRAIPPERLRLEDYAGDGPDSIYLREAALLEDWQLDRVAFRISGASWRAADQAHWLALDVAARALEDAGRPEGEGLDRDGTGVLVGNSLTGETSRAGQMRLRWPYVRRTVAAALEEAGWDGPRRGRFLAALEERYKAPFPEPGDETLAGGLANTIAGRIANHFDFHGGGYTVDGACASSLLAVANACSALAAGDLEAAVAGGVDLSLDPFELVGFSRTGAFTRERMRVYDARSAGFLPGEGCGMVVLVRLEDARRLGLRVHAVIRGWGISSDGAGGLTRPKVPGQRLALERAYRRAGFGAGTVGYFEGHGTGTAVGDPVELEALAEARRGDGVAPPAAVGSVKAIVGHTKAAAGVAGLLKAVMAVRDGVLPPTVGCEEPHPVLAPGEGATPALRTLERAEPWPAGVPLRAGVSAFGFGGINAHVVLEGAPRVSLAARRPGELPARVRRLDGSRQDAELLLLAAPDRDGLAARAEALADRVRFLSHAELADLAAELAGADGAAASTGRARGCVVAATPAEAAERLGRLAAALRRGGGAAGTGPGEPSLLLEPRHGHAAAQALRPPRLAFLFPGQGVPARRDGGAWARRFPEYEAVCRLVELPEPPEPLTGEGGGVLPTDLAQPAIAASSLGALAVLERLGLEAVVGLGHSLGELAALAWAGSLEGEALLRLARERGAAMASVADPDTGDGGAMAGLACGPAEAAEIVAGTGAVLAGFNGPGQTVVSGPSDAVEAAVRRARQRSVGGGRLRVSHAFHSPLMASAAPVLAAALEREAPAPPVRRLASTVTGALWSPEDAPAELLVRQLSAPVRFTEALAAAADEGVDLWIEVGPGRVLGDLARRAGAAPVLSLDAGGPGLGGLLAAVGTAWVLGAPVAVEELFRDRDVRPLVRHAFLTNPCETAPVETEAAPGPGRTSEEGDGGDGEGAPAPSRVLPGGAAPDTPRVTGAPDRSPARPPVSPVSSSPASAAPAPAAAAPAGPSAAPSGGEPPAADPLAVLRELVAERAELPPEAVGEEDRMLSDLHLSSIAVGQLVVEAARRVGAPPPASPTDYADASVVEIAAVLAERVGTGGEATPEAAPPAGVDAWVRPFHRRLVAEPLVAVPPALPPALLPTGFHLLSGDDAGDAGLAAALRSELHRRLPAVPLEEAGLRVVLLPGDPGPADVHRLLQATRGTASGAESGVEPGRPSAPLPRLAVVHRGGGGGFARSFHLERPGGEVVVVELPAAPAPAVPELAPRLAAEVLAPVPSGGYREAVYDEGGRRHVPRLALLPPVSAGAGAAPPDLPLGPEDVLLVTGGGRGIAAECGLDLARRSGAALALVGRSRPQESRELADNLERFAAAGVRFRYLRADVTDAAETAEAVAEAERELGPVTAVLHGAGRNRPRRVADLTPEDVARTVAVKAAGLDHVLAAVEPERLRLLVAFGSIIAEMGVRGEADYALANELLARRVERFAAHHPACRCHTLEWSVWSGVGMGERLGTLESLMAQGITPIPADRGVAELADLLSRPGLPATVVVAGRFGDPPTVDLPRPELPFLRFLETPRIHVPGVELVVEAEVSDASDPYLEDHDFAGERLFPAVLGLEAMAQVAAVLTGGAPDDPPPVFGEVRFTRPVAVPPGQRTVLRLAGLVRQPDRVEVVLRSSTTAFQVDHFRAVVHPAEVPAAAAAAEPLPAEAVPLDPAADLYGGVLFHGGRFRRLAGYHLLRATRCVAEIGPRAEGETWFARHLPADLLLGDPGARDAVIHAVQASIPHATVLPTGVERLVPGRLDAGAVHRVEARERSRDGRDLVYDLEVLDAGGRRVERWEGLALRAVADRPAPDSWPLPLLAPHVERRLGDLVPGARPSVVLTAAREGEEDRRSASDRAVAAVAGASVVRFRRPDGRRVAAVAGGDEGRGGISVSHGAGLVMAVAGEVAVGCDLEPVARRDAAVWRDLLGSRAALAELLEGEAGDDPDAAATRVWAAGEALKKLGLPVDAPLVFASAAPDGWVLLASGDHRVAALVTRVRGVDARLALALALPAEAAATGDRLRAS